MGRSIRWQALIAFLGIVLLAAIFTTTARDFTNIAVPAKGGVYTEAVVGSPRAINPLLSLSSELDNDLSGLIFQGLVTLNERAEPAPALAESWQFNADEKEVTFNLRRSVRWSDGAPFTAADVVYTVGVLQSDAFANSGQAGSTFLSQLWRNVTVEQLDDYTVRFRLQQPLASFLAENTVGILPAHLWGRVPNEQFTASLLNLQPVGTGRWRVADLNAQEIRLEPNPYSSEAPPLLEALVFRFYPDYPSAFAAFRQGEVDGVRQILPQDIAEAQQSKQMQVLSAPVPGETFVYFNLNSTDAAFLSDTTIRQALYLALDQNKLIDGALNGQGIPADSPLVAGTWAYAPQQHAADPERAAQMLTDAGWTDSDRDGVRDREGINLSFELLGDNDPLLQALAEQWRQIGVEARPHLVTLLSLAADYLSPRTYQAAVTHWQLVGDPDPYPLWHSTQVENGQNYTGWSNSEADQLMEKGRSINDPGRRIQLYEQFQQIFAQELPALPLYYDVYTFGVSGNVKDVEVGRLNWPWQRFQTADQWHVTSQSVSVEDQP